MKIQLLILLFLPALAFAQYSPKYEGVGAIDTFIVKQYQEATYEYQPHELRIWFKKTQDSIIVGAAEVVYYREAIANPEAIWRGSTYYRLMGRNIFPK
jgi:hypothetical protein